MFGIEDVKTYDGYQVFVTTEFDLSEREVVRSYKIRDQTEKAFADSEKCTRAAPTERQNRGTRHGKYIRL